eukprot:420831-Rhodomonas_salina.1
MLPHHPSILHPLAVLSPSITPSRPRHQHAKRIASGSRGLLRKVERSHVLGAAEHAKGGRGQG